MYYWLMPKLDVNEQRDRFFSHVDRTSSPKGCWIWTGTLNASGYGRIKITFTDGTFERLAHRVSYRWWKGPIPMGLLVCHIRACSDSTCVNPAHLYTGTDQDNTDDRVAVGNQPKGRTHHMHLHPEYAARGAAAGRSKLTDVQVRVARALHRRDHMIKSIARRFGVTATAISAIVHSKTWRHLW